MKRRINRKTWDIYAYDIETHADEESIALNETGVWLSSFINEESKVEDESNYYYDIPSFLARLAEMTAPGQKRKNNIRPTTNVMIYIWNLSFEWSYILPVLLEMGIPWMGDTKDGDDVGYSSVSTKTGSSVWQANVRLVKGGGMVCFRDLSKIFPGKLRDVAKSFGLHTQKGDIDYRINRRHGWKVTAKEKDYVFRDTRIIIEILLEMEKRGDREFWQSISTASFSNKKALKYGFRRAFKPLSAFRKIYPCLDADETAFLRKGVEGGITYPVKGWQFVEIDSMVGHIDIHQAHPTQMAYKRFPCGKGEYFKGKPKWADGSISCCHIAISYSGVKLHSVIKLIPYDILTDFELWVWDFEIPTMMKCYENLEIRFIDGYRYQSKRLPWRQYYIENYQKRLKAKKEKDLFNIFFYKLLNNASYGKFLEHGHQEVFENYITKAGTMDSIVHAKEGADINGTYTYVPLGSAIPAYTRVMLVETAMRLGWRNIVYFDTDSIFFLLNDETEKALKTIDLKDHLGGWGREPDILKCQFTCAKRYKLEVITGRGDNFLMLGYDIKVAGVSNYGNDGFKTNLVNGVFTAHTRKRAKGGTLIVDTEKRLEVQKKYKDTYAKNKGKVYNG